MRPVSLVDKSRFQKHISDEIFLKRLEHTRFIRFSPPPLFFGPIIPVLSRFVSTVTDIHNGC